MTEEPAGQTRRALRLRVSGRVQGVGYRYFVLRLARELGVAGWVRNLPDGAVALGVVGPAADLELFKERLKVGPAGARVLALEEEEMPSAPDWDRFEIV